MTSLAFSNLTVSYGDSVAVDSFTDVVRPGEWLCLIGPNGAGKSSLLRSVAGVVKHAGEIRVDGTSLRFRSVASTRQPRESNSRARPSPRPRDAPMMRMLLLLAM